MAAVEVDDFSVSKSAANSFNVTVASIVHSNKLPDVADTDCIFELLEGFIHHGFIHYGPKGNLSGTNYVCNNYTLILHMLHIVHTYVHTCIRIQIHI